MNVPSQGGNLDCGLYCLLNLQLFLEDFCGMQGIALSEGEGAQTLCDWYTHVEVDLFRKAILGIIDRFTVKPGFVLPSQEKTAEDGFVSAVKFFEAAYVLCGKKGNYDYIEDTPAESVPAGRECLRDIYRRLYVGACGRNTEIGDETAA